MEEVPQDTEPTVDKKPAEQEEDESEYDSANGYSEKGSKKGSDVEPEEPNVKPERESGDGQESVPPRKVDDDEDKKNPQYIPKKGTFYEHDDRTADDVENENETETEKNEKELKKKIWQDEKEKWSHDRFNDLEQAPKSRTELVSIYGYDIRNEDGPPKARRRRRYGRGPNKYTRNWEDEDAYVKTQVTRPKKPPVKKSFNNEEYPPLNKEHNKKDIFNQNKNTFRNSSVSEKKIEENKTNVPSSSYEDKSNIQEINKNRIGSGRVIKPKKEIKDSDYKGFTTKTRQVRNVRTEHQKIVPKQQQLQQQQQQQPQQPQHQQQQEQHQLQKHHPQQQQQQQQQQKQQQHLQSQQHHHQQQHHRQQQHQHHQHTQQKHLSQNDNYVLSQNFTNRNLAIQELDETLGKMNLNNNYKGINKHNQGKQGNVPPRLQQNEQKGSKRYSSIRQRAMPENAASSFNQQTNYYPNEFNQNAAGHLNHPSPTQIPPLQQVPVTGAQILSSPQFAPPFPQAPPQFLPPSVAPPFIPQQTPQIINYVPGQPQFSQGYQGFQQQFNPVTQPDGLFQTGITYYSADQQINQRAAPQKRPKAAIPIVAPPNLNNRNEDEITEQIIENNNLKIDSTSSNNNTQ